MSALGRCPRPLERASTAAGFWCRTHARADSESFRDRGPIYSMAAKEGLPPAKHTRCRGSAAPPPPGGMAVRAHDGPRPERWDGGHRSRKSLATPGTWSITSLVDLRWTGARPRTTGGHDWCRREFDRIGEDLC